MTGPRHEGVPDKRTGYLELFFDLVFVFAITQLVSMLHADHGAGGWFHLFLMAWLVWWAWSQFTWAGNAIDLDRRPTRIALLAVTALTLVVATAMPAAFTSDGGVRFALPYAAVRLGGLGLYWVGLRDDPSHQAALRTYLPVAAVSPLVVVAGGLAPEGARPWIWLVAVAVDITSALGAGRGEFRVGPAHFAERHALFVIIALGESIVGVGATVTGLELTGVLLLTTLAAFAIVASQWWGYFDWVQEAAEARLASEADLRARGHLARDLFTFGHFPIVVGSVVFAAGAEDALVHPTDALGGSALVAVGGGLALFLVGFLAGNARARGTVLVERAVALVAVVGCVVALGPRVSAVALLVVLALVLVGLAAVETGRGTSARPAAHPLT